MKSTVLSLVLLAALAPTPEPTTIESGGSLKEPKTFDSLKYKDNRTALIREFYKGDTTLSSAMVSHSVWRLFELGCPQAFWQSLYADKVVSHVYFNLEVVGQSHDPHYTAHTVFKAGQEFYWATWSNRYSEDTNSFYYCDCEYPLELSYKLLTGEEVASFLEQIDAAYHPLDRVSFISWEHITPTPELAFVFVSYDEKENLFFVDNIYSGTLLATNLQELGRFLDRLCMNTVEIMLFHIDHTENSSVREEARKWLESIIGPLNRWDSVKAHDSIGNPD